MDPFHMHDIVFSKAADNMEYGVYLPNMGEELVTQPFPRLAPLTNPAISTNSTVAGVTFFGWYMAAKPANRSSGTATTPRFGSIVQKG